MDDKQAFLFGGVVALLAWGLLWVTCQATGGYARADWGGLLLIFIIGGVIGLVVNYIRVKRRGDG